ncbi:hypothetical protein KC957_02405, partial [Candidatus Saccharibacteria bacterium]|nr:hypothetical protein [Candidatus Saccharibacteria bacterium]
VAAYKYIPTSTQGLVWFITSLFCLVLYAHALVKLKAPLLNYILIFTLLSLFESSVSIVNVPVYYYGWVMAALGIGLQALSMRGRVSSDFAESSNTMSSIFLPLAVCISLFMTPQHGAGQLGVSLLFAACFYGLGAVRSVGNERASNVVIAHISALAGVSSLVYALTNDSLIVGVTLLVLAVIQVGSLVTQQQNRVLYNALTTTVASALISLVFLYASPALFTLGVAVVIVSTLVSWSMCQRDDLYVIATVGWLALPLVVGQMLLQPALDIREQAILSLVSLALHVVLFVFAVLPEKRGELTATARAMLALHILLTLSIALAGSAGFALVLIVAIGLLILPLSMLDESRFWAAFSGAVVASSVLRLWTDALLSLALFVSLGYSILLALRFRDEANRWMSTGLWLLVPIGLGGATVQTTWPPEYFAWAYVVAMIGLIISRMIARGRVFVSGNIPLSSYAQSASVSYVAGYVTAGFLAVAISLAAGNSQLHTSLILIVLSMLCVAISRFVEQKSSILAALPFLGQGILFSVARPTASSDAMVVTLLFSTAIAVGAYLLFNNLEDVRNTERHPGVYAAIMTTCINPAFIVVLPATIWVMPVGLSVLGLVLLDYTRKETQDSREVSVGLIVAGVLWLLGYLGIREVQAYTHIIAAMFAGFAYWRHRRGERQQSNTYLYWMLGTATVPLIFQSMGQAGDIYGWWLLLEQVAFMLLGMAIQRRFVTMWALYVAIGAVLYQLRDLGYAALAVLATFVIGIAVYQLQKHDKK